MTLRLTAAFLSIFILAGAGALAAAEAGGFGLCGLPGAARVQAVERGDGLVRTVWRQPVYGRSEYRCAHYSSRCGYTRPLLYWRTWVTWRRAPAAEPSAVADEPAGERYRYRGWSVTVVERRGAFARIDMPGNASHWVRTSALVEVE